MDNKILEQYKNQMLQMHRTATNPSATTDPITTLPNNVQGNLVGIVSTVRSLYPVQGAKVTVFTGDYQNMNIIDTDLTDQSGRTKIFNLPTPSSGLSLDSQNTAPTYALYNMLIEADGYIKNVHLNIPVFGTVTSLQRSNLILEETAGTDKGPQIFDEAQKYEL